MADNTVKKNRTLQSVLLYLFLTLLSLMLMGSFVSDNVYLNASRVTTNPAGVVNEYAAAIGDGVFGQPIPGANE